LHYTDLVIKSNSLIEGFMNMTQNEYKFILYLISKIKKEDKEFRKQSISVKEFAEILNVKSEWLYTYLKSFEESLVSRKIKILHKNGDRLYIPWFGYIRYKEFEGIIEVAFNYDLSPFLINIDIPYTKYFLANVKCLDSIYAIRIYELLKQYESLNSRTVEINLLKQMLGIKDDEYKLYGDFKRRVILKAQEEINLKTDIYFEFQEIKQHRKKVTALQFIISSKSKEEHRKEIAVPSEHLKEIIEEFKRLYNGVLIDTFVQKMLDKKGIEHIRECLKTYQDHIQHRTISNIAGDFFTYVMKGYEKPIKKIHIPTYADFKQRDYSEEFFEKFYANLESDKSGEGN
jgi:plasmid replication initiation protein